MPRAWRGSAKSYASPVDAERSGRVAKLFWKCSAVLAGDTRELIAQEACGWWDEAGSRVPEEEGEQELQSPNHREPGAATWLLVT